MNDRDGASDADGFFRTGRRPRLGFPFAETYALACVADLPERWRLLTKEELPRPAFWGDGYFRGWAEALSIERSPPAAWAIAAFDAGGDITACVEVLPVMREGLMAGVTLADARGSRLWVCRSPIEEVYREAAALGAAAISALPAAGAVAP